MKYTSSRERRTRRSSQSSLVEERTYTLLRNVCAQYCVLLQQRCAHSHICNMASAILQCSSYALAIAADMLNAYSCIAKAYKEGSPSLTTRRASAVLQVCIMPNAL